MIRLSFIAVLLFLVTAGAEGKCDSAPTLKLSSSTGSICGISTFTISGNTFGGSASMVIITNDGRGSVFPIIATSSPFSFSYTPVSADIGKKITITITTNDPPGRDCKAVKTTFTLTVNELPSAPDISTVTQPGCSKMTGSVVLRNLPGDGRWTITASPEITSVSGTGSSAIVSNLQTGKYNFRVTTSAECTSAWSDVVNIQPPPFVPVVKITDPPPVCFPATVDLTESSVTSGSSTGLVYTYWRNSSATQNFDSPSTAPDGTYYIKGTASSGCSDIKPVRVTVVEKPVADAGPDMILEYQFTTRLGAKEPDRDESGSWSVIKGSGSFSDKTDARTTVSGLAIGKNIFLWTIKNKVCNPAYDSVTVTVKDIVVPNLITPNMDGRNDRLVIPQNESTGRTELLVFDRNGIKVYSTPNYNNEWNGINFKGNPLPEGTYFYILKFQNGRSASGYLVVRR